MNRNPIITIICALLILLWAYAALSKLAEFSLFTVQLGKQPLPGWSLPILRWGLPLGELIIAFLLASPKYQYPGLVASTLLMAIFTGYVMLALSGSFGHIPCSCAGIISKLHWKGHLIFNIICLIISILGTILKKRDSNLTYNRQQTLRV